MIEQRATTAVGGDGIGDAGRRRSRGRFLRARLLLSGLALLLLAGAPARAEDDDDDPPHITVRGTASMPAVPDLAVLRLVVGAEDADAAAALKAAAVALAAVTEAAQAQGVVAADIETGSTTLDRAAPETAGGPRVFRAATALRVRLHDPARSPGRVGAVLAALAARGATRVEGVDYRLADPAALLARLTGQAVADARRRAEAAATAANVKLGELLSIEPPDEPAGGSRIDRVPGGADTVSTTVEVDYAIDR